MTCLALVGGLAFIGGPSEDAQYPAPIACRSSAWSDVRPDAPRPVVALARGRDG
jgi:hypothetical protein